MCWHKKLINLFYNDVKTLTSILKCKVGLHLSSKGHTKASLAIIYPPLSDVDCLSDIGLPASNEGILSFTKNKKHKMLVGFK